MLRQIKTVLKFLISLVLKLKKRSYLLCLSSAAVLILPFAYGNFWFFAWFGFVPLFFALENKPKGKAFLLAYLSGVIFWLGTIYWLANVTVVGYILLVLYLALYFGFFGLVISRPRLQSISYYLLFVPTIWVVLEHIRSYLFTGFPWALLGYSQYKNPVVIQIADITGAWGVSFVVMLINIAIYKLIKIFRLPIVDCRLRSEIRRSLPLAFLILIIVLGYGFYKLQPPPPNSQTKTLRVSVVQGNIPLAQKWSPEEKSPIIEKYLSLTESALQDAPDLIVWPEATSPCYLGEEKWCFNRVADFIRKAHLPLLMGTVSYAEGFYYNSAILIDKTGEITQKYHKLHLVPFGEYVPLRRLLTFVQTIASLGDMTPGKDYTVFTIPDHKADVVSRFSVLICFEDVFPELSRRFAKEGAEFLVNITNDVWFGRTSCPYQHLAASVFRAVENNLFMVRCANTGVSAFINPNGKIISSVRDDLNNEIFIAGYRTQDINAKNHPTLYCRFGEFFIFLLYILLICSIVRVKKHR